MSESMVCPVCGDDQLIHRRDLTGTSVASCLWMTVYCIACNGQGTYPPQSLAVLAAQEAELHDGACCDPGDAA
jgi:hypothetical protein